MRVEIITSGADPDHGGSGARVHGIVSMFATFADVRVVRTHWFHGPQVPGVEYRDLPVRDGFGTRLERMRTYYRRTFPRRSPESPPDLVVVESLDLIGLHQYGPGVPMILDEHNVYWNLLRYELPSSPFFRGWVGRRPALRNRLVPRLLERARRYEVNAIRGAARTLVTSDEDRKAILEECPDVAARVQVLPNCVDVQRIPPLPDAPDPKTLLFIGDFNYVPNREAATYIAGDLAPSLPDTRFLLVGANPPSVNGPNVTVTGRVADVLPYLRTATVCIAPLANGSGTRIKILTYLAAAKPVVATAKACEGLPVRDGTHLLLREEGPEFLEAVRSLLAGPDERRRLGTGGRTLVSSMFDWRAHVDALRALSLEVCAGGTPTPAAAE